MDCSSLADAAAGQADFDVGVRLQAGAAEFQLGAVAAGAGGDNAGVIGERAPGPGRGG